MVKRMETEYRYAAVDEEELDALLSGQAGARKHLWTQWTRQSVPRLGSVGVIWHSEDREDPIRPLVLIVNEGDIRRLCGRYAQLHSDLSPLTAWCHLLTPRFVDPLDSLVRIPDPQGLQAAWTGLSVAEAILIAERPLASIKISACLATHSFAVARTNALWRHLTIDDVTRRCDHANRLLKGEGHQQRFESRATRIRGSLQPIWEALSGVALGRGSYISSELHSIILALRGLVDARSAKDPDEAIQLVRPLLNHVPEAQPLVRLNDIAPEGRLRVFDQLVQALDRSEPAREKPRRTALALLAGYLATIAAGGSPSLTLAEGHASRWPEITAWAFLVGGLGEKVVWTSSFDGLGRLVARELLRPLRLDEPPTCDFAFDEAAVLADAKLTDPLVHLKVKQARLMTVELLPGVNVPVPIGDPTAQRTSNPDVSRVARASDAPTSDPIRVLADAMWPHIRARLDDYFVESQRDEESGRDGESAQLNRGKRKGGSQRPLPLKDPKRD